VEVEVEDGASNINICSSSHDIFTHTLIHTNTHAHTHFGALTGAKALNIDWHHLEYLVRIRIRIRICPLLVLAFTFNQ